MFSFLFGTASREPELDDGFDLEAAAQTLRGRMDAMMEYETKRKTRFTIIEHPQR